MATRVLVTGRYINKSTYVLYNEDGSTFQVIKEGESFRIDNQQREWFPIRVTKKNGKGTILMCQKFRDSGEVIEEFPLIHNKRGLWALTSGAARNGVFHNYIEPKTNLEKQLSEMGLSARIIEKCGTIDVELELGGEIYSHCIRNSEYGCITDGKQENLTKPEYNKGYMTSTYEARIYDAMYVIYYSVGVYINGRKHRNIQRVIITQNTNRRRLLKS